MDLVGLLRATCISGGYAAGGIIIGAVITSALLPLHFVHRFRPFGELLAVGLKSAPAFVFPLAVGGLIGGGGWQGVLMKMLVSGLICFFPILTGAMDGRGRVPQGLRRTCDAYGATRVRRLVTAEHGWITAGVVAGLKTAVPLAVVGAIVAEYVSPTEALFAALGARMSVHRNDAPALWGDIVAATTLGCGMYWAVRRAERKLEKRLRLAW
jgi:NitT/TauT family transport system permease protein